MTYADFLQLPEEYRQQQSRYKLLPIPLECTVSSGKGTAKGPEAILEQSAQLELYDEQLEQESYEEGILTLPAVPVKNFDHLETPNEELLKANLELIEKEAKKHISKETFLISLGGEHSITWPLVKAHKEVFGDFTVIQFDAHADMKYSYYTIYSHASVMRRIYAENIKVVQAGIRSIDADEWAFCQKENIPFFFDHKIREKGMRWLTEQLLNNSTEQIYITIDLDALNPAEMPAVGTPEPGGFSWHELLFLLETLFKNKKVIGADVVELSPISHLLYPNQLAAKLVYKLIGFWKKYQQKGSRE